jgi:hypothetical protein
MTDDTTPARSLLSLPLLLGVLAFAAGEIHPAVFSDGDPYWHLTTGEWILAHGRVPTTDPFSWSRPGMAWTAHEWLSEVVMVALYRIGGWAAIHHAVSASFGITAAYLTRFLLARMSVVSALALSILSLGLMHSHFAARPHALVWPVTALWVGTLVHAGEQRRGPPWWLLGVLVLWANLHASVTLAVGFACALAMDALWQEHAPGERAALARRWGLFIGASMLLTLANPRGFGAIEYTLEVMRMKDTLDIVSEWRSADFHHFHAILAWLGLVMSVSFAGILRLSIIRSIFVIGLLYMALKHQRYHALVGLVSPYLLAAPLGRGIAAVGGGQPGATDTLLGRLGAPASWLGRGLALALCLVTVLATRSITGKGPGVWVTPKAAVDAALARGAQGRVLNDYIFGGYFIRRGIPVYIDGRGDAYGDSTMRAMRNAFDLRSSGALDSLLDGHQVQWTVLRSGVAAIALLDHLPNWRRAYADSVAVVHLRRGPTDR